MTEQQQIVYTTGWIGGQTYHLTKECLKLQQSDNIVEKRKADVAHYDICKDCDPEYTPDRTEHIGPICPNCGERQKRLMSHLPCDQ